MWQWGSARAWSTHGQGAMLPTVRQPVPGLAVRIAPGATARSPWPYQTPPGHANEIRKAIEGGGLMAPGQASCQASPRTCRPGRATCVLGRTCRVGEGNSTQGSLSGGQPPNQCCILPAGESTPGEAGQVESPGAASDQADAPADKLIARRGVAIMEGGVVGAGALIQAGLGAAWDSNMKDGMGRTRMPAIPCPQLLRHSGGSWEKPGRRRRATRPSPRPAPVNAAL